MKLKAIAVSVASLILTILPFYAADEKEPVIQQRNGWIIISGNAEDGGDRGPLPWTYAIRASAVTSVKIATDVLRADNPDGSKKRFHDATEEEIRAVPAFIEITTTELTSEGDYRRYQLRGLNHATAPPLLEKVLKAVTDSSGEQAGE
jgi:hypothetical protein